MSRILRMETQGIVLKATKYHNNSIRFSTESIEGGFPITLTGYNVLDIYPEDTCKQGVRLLMSNSEISPVYGGYHFLSKEDAGAVYKNNKSFFAGNEVELEIRYNVLKINVDNESINNIHCELVTLDGRRVFKKGIRKNRNTPLYLELPKISNNTYIIRIYGKGLKASEKMILPLRK